MSSYLEHIEKEENKVRDYIETVEDYTVLSDTEQVGYNHFKRKYPKLDWILEKTVYNHLLDLLCEGTDTWCRYEGVIHGSHEMGVNNFSPYYDDPIFIVNYDKSIFELYRKVFGVGEDTVELYTDNNCISQIECDFFHDLYDYSKDVVQTVWLIMEKEGAIYLSGILDELYKDRKLILPNSYLEPPARFLNSSWDEGSFTHPKLQKNWCYRYVGCVRITDVPLTEPFVDRHNKGELYLDKKKVDFQNITPVFSGDDGSSYYFFSNKEEEEEEKLVA